MLSLNFNLNRGAFFTNKMFCLVRFLFVVLLVEGGWRVEKQFMALFGIKKNILYIRRIVVKMDGMRPKKFVKIVCGCWLCGVCILSHNFLLSFRRYLYLYLYLHVVYCVTCGIFVVDLLFVILYFFSSFSPSFIIWRSEYSLNIFYCFSFSFFVVALQLKFFTRLTIRLFYKWRRYIVYMYVSMWVCERVCVC